jgi:hypothetical protein
MLATLALAAQIAATPVTDMNWLAGYWLQCGPDREVAEYWSDVRGGALFNTTINLSGSRVQTERTAIADIDGVLTFIHEPTGGATAFPAIEVGERRVVFQNLENDFPHRVIYERDGDVLTGRIEGTIDGQPRSMEWVYRSAELNARCVGFEDEAG